VPDDKLPLWSVEFTGTARKQKQKLPKTISASLDLLWGELERDGQERRNWPHYGLIVGKQDMHHCHLNKGKPCYVAVWKVINRDVRRMEIRYVGTHENANYRRID